MEILIGADPELFVKNKRSGRFVSAHNLIPGSKEEPFKVPFGAVQPDGVSAEFNIEPVKTLEEFKRNLKAVRNTMQQMIIDKNSNLILVEEPVADFSKSTFDKIPAEAKVLGCTPDWNAYSMTMNPPPNADGVYFRTGSGHVHIGWTNGVDEEDPEHIKMCATLTKMLDYFLYSPSTLWDTDQRRRELYGKPGTFRPKHYGCEYRVLSNKWLKHDVTIDFVFDTINKVVDMLTSGVARKKYSLVIEELTARRCYNFAGYSKDYLVRYFNDFLIFRIGLVTREKMIELLECR